MQNTHYKKTDISRVNNKQPDQTILHDYWRSTASYRVRIALNMAKIDYQKNKIDLLAGEQKSEHNLLANPQGYVPVLFVDGLKLTQSLSIIEYLDETRNLNLLPQHPADRAKVRALAHIIAMDTHPICNPSVLAYALRNSKDNDEARAEWMGHFIRKGLAAFELLLGEGKETKFCFGDRPSLADLCLIPQLYNANRWHVDIADLTRIAAINTHCEQLPEFIDARPKA